MRQEKSRWALRLVTVTVVVIAATLAMVAGSVGSAGAATKLKNCSLAGHYRNLGPTYAETLGVSGATCSDGLKLIKAYNACRIKNGGTKGHCRTTVLGFKCSEIRTNSPLEFIGQVTCTRAQPRETVRFDYTEAT